VRGEAPDRETEKAAPGVNSRRPPAGYQVSASGGKLRG